MRIDPKSLIAGQPALKIRSFCRRFNDYSWSIDLVRRQFQLDDASAERLITQLTDLGYVEKVRSSTDRPAWEISRKGRRLASANATKPVHRETADKRLHEFMERVKRVNGDDYFLYKVSRVLLFGSYLRSKEKLGDLDLAIELKWKEENEEKRKALEKARVKEAIANGRNFRDMIDEGFWPQEEVRRFLRARSRVISLTSAGNPILNRCRTRVLFDEKSKPLDLLSNGKG